MRNSPLAKLMERKGKETRKVSAEDRAIDLKQAFRRSYGRDARIYRAPGRVNLIGEHTDYNDGFVMPAAIGFSTHVGISPRSDGKLLVHSDEFPGNFEFEVHRLPARRTGEWCDHILGVASVLHERGCLSSGANLLVHGEVP